jgi:RNA polymerase sigma-70 factor (sigma-E family)
MSPDEEAAEFAALYASRSAALMRYGYVLTGNRHDAADLVQEAFVRLRLAWHRVADRANAEGYLRTTMVRLHISWWRRIRRERLVGRVPESVTEDAALREVGDDQDLWSALGRLPVRQRTVLVLRYYEDASDHQIADTLGISEPTVRSHALRGLRALRKSWIPTAAIPTAVAVPQRVPEER